MSHLDVVSATPTFTVIFLVSAEHPVTISAFSERLLDVVFLNCQDVRITDHLFHSVTKCPENPISYILRDGGSQIVDNDQCGQVSLTGSLCLTFGTGPLSPFLDICHVMVIYHVTNYTDED